MNDVTIVRVWSYKRFIFIIMILMIMIMNKKSHCFVNVFENYIQMILKI